MEERLAMCDPMVRLAGFGGKWDFYPCREGVYVPWTLSDDGIWLPWNQHPAIDPFMLNTVHLTHSAQRTVPVPASTQHGEEWRGEHAMVEVECFSVIHLGARRIYSIHPEIWEALGDAERAQFEPYEVLVDDSG